MNKDRRSFIKQAGFATCAIPLLSCASFDEDGKIISDAIKAKALKSGDTIGVTAPAGAVFDQEDIAAFQQKMDLMGFKTVLGKTLSSQHGYLAGTDELRAKEINDFFKDDNIDAIFAMRGGWGCARILHLLDYDLIKANPKVIMGFSDLTSLLNSITYHTGLVTFHGLVGSSSWDVFSTSYFVKTVMNGEKVVMKNDAEDPTTILKIGKARGKLFGGNLSVLSGIIGSAYEPNWKDSILFIEEVGEEPYRIDRMLTQMKLAGIFDEVKGIVFGKFRKCTPEEPEKSFTLMQVLAQHTKDLKVPAFYGASFGHVKKKFTLPIGALAEMDAAKGTITLLEESVLR